MPEKWRHRDQDDLITGAQLEELGNVTDDW